MAAEQITAIRLRIVSGAASGQEFVIQPGVALILGSNPKLAGIALSDPGLSQVHFVLELHGAEAQLRDLNSMAGTFVNGVRVPAATLRDGDLITAGACTCQVELESGGQQRQKLTPPLAAARLLSKDPVPAYALLDAARTPDMLPMLQRSGFPHRSAFEGQAGAGLAHVAPYLVQLEKNSEPLDRLMEQVWGPRMALFVSSSAPFDAVRLHFRDKLVVQNEAGKKLYFRFYDPRVLASYLPTCTAAEAREFFGPARVIRIEGARPELVEEFECGPSGVTRREFAL